MFYFQTPEIVKTMASIVNVIAVKTLERNYNKLFRANWEGRKREVKIEEGILSPTFQLTRLEKQDSRVSQVHVNEMIRFMSHVAKI